MHRWRSILRLIMQYLCTTCWSNNGRENDRSVAAPDRRGRLCLARRFVPHSLSRIHRSLGYVLSVVSKSAIQRKWGVTFFSRVPRFFRVNEIVSRRLRRTRHRIGPKFVVRFFYPLNFSTCCISYLFLFFFPFSFRLVSFCFFKRHWDNTAERVLVISAVNAAFLLRLFRRNRARAGKKNTKNKKQRTWKWKQSVCERIIEILRVALFRAVKGIHPRIY